MKQANSECRFEMSSYSKIHKGNFQFASLGKCFLLETSEFNDVIRALHFVKFVYFFKIEQLGSVLTLLLKWNRCWASTIGLGTRHF